ncbi:MAG: class A beta-lactamase-related serine hydrolase [candidate division KSB1 bacterium]|nr:class A beta-lactamase-related serine hydrolase [candidate division KSB1 bacterium]
MDLLLQRLWVVGICALMVTCARGPSPTMTIPKEVTREALTEPQPCGALQELLRAAAEVALRECGTPLSERTLWASLIDLSDPRLPKMASYGGAEQVYPASVVKAFYMVAAYHQVQEEMLRLDRSLRRDLRLMIEISDNEATNRIVDRLTNTTSGDSLAAPAYEEFAYKRNWMNRYFRSLGFTHVNACQKTWDGEPYGRDLQLLGLPDGPNYVNSNKLTTDETALLLYLIYQRKVVSRSACQAMLKLMRRAPDPADLFLAGVVPPDGRLWSKQGLVDSKRHDAGIIHLANGRRFILVVFTDKSAGDCDLLRRFARRVVDHYASLPRAHPG